jgi:hypothetical protein
MTALSAAAHGTGQCTARGSATMVALVAVFLLVAVFMASTVLSGGGDGSLLPDHSPTSIAPRASAATIMTAAVTDAPLRGGDAPLATPSLNTPACSDMALLSTPPGGAERFLRMEAPAPAMGLTNQLIAYSEALALALLAGRTLVLPAAATPPATELLDAAATAAAVACLGARVITAAEFDLAQTKTAAVAVGGGDDRAPARRRTPKPPKLSLPSRGLVMQDSATARDALERGLRASHGAAVLRVGAVLWHVPFTHRDIARGVGPAAMFAATRLAPALRQRAAATARSLGLLASAPLAAFHARFERDVANFSPRHRPPSASAVQRFLSACVVPRLSARNVRRVVVLGSVSTMHPDVVAAIERGLAAASIAVIFPRPTVRAVGGAEEAATPSRSGPTNHADAAVDSELALAHADVLIGADFSTFTRAIQLRRCADRARRPLELLTYDAGLTRLSVRAHSCDEVTTSLWATHPHAFVPGFQESASDVC